MTFWSHTDKTSARPYHPGAVNVKSLNIARGLVWKNLGNVANSATLLFEREVDKK
jgi:hypothetical protein